MPSLKDVEQFWESHPLFVGESQYELGTQKFFDEHDKICIDECQGGEFDIRTLPTIQNKDNVLDLGCGIGFWTVQFLKRGCRVVAADLTHHALEATKQRSKFYGFKPQVSKQNAENMTFKNESFRHVNCQGVIHHTPNTNACVAEIHRVLEEGGTASISVYYKNIFLRIWPLLSKLGKLMHRLGFKLQGRGRSAIYTESNVNEIVRLYDGNENPIGKAYTKKEFISMLSPYFIVEETYLHFFPARSLPFRLSKKIKKLLDKHAGFMIYATLIKKKN